MPGLVSPESDIGLSEGKEIPLGTVRVGVFALNPDGSPRNYDLNVQVNNPDDPRQASIYGCSLILVEGHGRKKEYIGPAALRFLSDGYYYGPGTTEQKASDLAQSVVRAFSSASKRLRDLPKREKLTASGAVLAILPNLETDSKGGRAVFGWAGKAAVIVLNSSGGVEFRSQPHTVEGGKKLTKSLVQLGDGPQMKETTVQKGRIVILSTSRVSENLSDKEIEALRRSNHFPGELAQALISRVFEKYEDNNVPLPKRRVLAAAAVQF